MADPAAFNRKVKVFFLSCGSVENPAALQAHQQQLIAYGIKNTYVYFPRYRARMADLEEEPVRFRSAAVPLRHLGDVTIMRTSTFSCFLFGGSGRRSLFRSDEKGFRQFQAGRPAGAVTCSCGQVRVRPPERRMRTR